MDRDLIGFLRPEDDPLSDDELKTFFKQSQVNEALVLSVQAYLKLLWVASQGKVAHGIASYNTATYHVTNLFLQPVEDNPLLARVNWYYSPMGNIQNYLNTLIKQSGGADSFILLSLNQYLNPIAQLWYPKINLVSSLPVRMDNSTWPEEISISDWKNELQKETTD